VDAIRLGDVGAEDGVGAGLRSGSSHVLLTKSLDVLLKSEASLEVDSD
jgi:hypothetical protein